jgi:hypothetical protein
MSSSRLHSARPSFRAHILALFMISGMSARAHIAPFVKGMYCENVCPTSSSSFHSDGLGRARTRACRSIRSRTSRSSSGGCTLSMGVTNSRRPRAFFLICAWCFLFNSSQADGGLRPAGGTFQVEMAECVRRPFAPYRADRLRRNKVCTTLGDQPPDQLGNFVCGHSFSTTVVGSSCLSRQGNCQNYDADTFGNYADGSCIFSPNLHARNRTDAASVT